MLRKTFDADDEICYRNPRRSTRSKPPPARRSEEAAPADDGSGHGDRRQRAAGSDVTRSLRPGQPASNKLGRGDTRSREPFGIDRSRAREAAGERRREIEEHLLRFRELERYIILRQTAETRAKQKVERYRPEETPPSLMSLAGHVKKLLEDWKCPFVGDVFYSLDSDDLVIDGKDRNANGKGVLAVTHAAFTVGLMQHCIASGTPHPGFVVIDTPLRHFRGPNEERRTRSCRRTFTVLVSVTGNLQSRAESVIIENVNPPAGLHKIAAVHSVQRVGRRGAQGLLPDVTTQGRILRRLLLSRESGHRDQPTPIGVTQPSEPCCADDCFAHVRTLLSWRSSWRPRTGQSEARANVELFPELRHGRLGSHHADVLGLTVSLARAGGAGRA